ncbi:MAG: beta-ketoacyl-[acyl-carrier-protein] synthase family protein, partial [Acidobacteriota bacterium]
MHKRAVITGMGVVSPNGMGVPAFWSATRAGVSGIGPITRFDASELPVQVAGEVRNFDEDLWVSAKDRPHVSRAVPLAIAAVSEALQQAGIDPAKLPRDQLRRIGVIVGSGGGSVEFTEEQYRLYHTGQWRQCSVYVVPSSTMGTLASEVSMKFGFRGLSHVITTGCTSSTDAVGYALQSVRAGSLDTIIVGGVDATIAPLILRGFIAMRIMSQGWNQAPERASRPFSRDRGGFVIAEGAWFFVVEERERALARGATILAEIAGYGSTCDAYHRVRLEECGEEPARAMGLALEDARVAGEQIGYLNYHGTGTELNDRIETRAVKMAFGDHADQLPGSSLKSLIGHPQGAAGAAGIAATILAMRDGFLPPTVNLDVADPECDLDYIPHIGRTADVEYAVCNCIAFGSKNSAV